MCQTGGPRCDTRVRERLAAAEGVLSEARTTLYAAWDRHEAEAVAWEAEYDTEYRDSDDANLLQARAAVRAAEDSMAAAYGEMCATRTGEEYVRDQAADNEMVAGMLDRAVKEGAYYRRRGIITRAVRDRDENDDLTGIIGKTGDTVTDSIVLEAARDYAANWSDHGPIIDIPAVKQYATEEEKTRGVRRWQTKLQGQAQHYWQTKQRVARAQEDVDAALEHARSTNDADPLRLSNARDWLTQMQGHLRSSQTRVVVYADKLRIAEQREVPGAA